MRVYIETYGCTLNKADTGLLTTILKSHGHSIVHSVDNADVIIINTCTVRKDTEERMVERIRYLRRVALKNKSRLIVVGCMAKAQPSLVLKTAPEADLISPANIQYIPNVLKSKRRVILISGYRRDKSKIPMYINGVIAAIAICEGCLGNCSYCIVKYARGPLQSYPPELIVKYVKEAISHGVKEIQLTAQDTAAYGYDIGLKLTDLLRDIVSLEGDFMVRIGMMNPHLALKILDELIEILREPKVYKFLHIPLQSGDDRVLKVMNRPYTVDEYRYLVRELRSKIPDLAIATDIIVGHPGEDEEAVENTIRVIKELMFDRIHVATYTIRPHTLSATMPQIPPKVKSERTRKVVKVAEEVTLIKHREKVGKTFNVLVTEYGKGSTVIGRTINYYPVVISEKLNLGVRVKVKIVDATFYDLRGIIVN